MHRSFLAAVVAMAGFLSAATIACAEDTSQGVTIVTYIEVAPAKAAEARKLVIRYAEAARKADGAVQVEAGQRISDPGHFALVERWNRWRPNRPSRRPTLARNSVQHSIRCAAPPMTNAFTSRSPSGR